MGREISAVVQFRGTITTGHSTAALLTPRGRGAVATARLCGDCGMVDGAGGWGCSWINAVDPCGQLWKSAYRITCAPKSPCKGVTFCGSCWNGRSLGCI